MTNFRGNGKLLLTGEYFVLDGVPGLAVPTRRGQSLTLSEEDGDGLRWTAFLADGREWFTEQFDAQNWVRSANVVEPGPQVRRQGLRARVIQLLSAAESLRPGCTNVLTGKRITTRLEFDRQWGLGSSSTLVACLARLLEVDPYRLLANTFGGSGYDLACAVHDTPIVFRRAGPIVRSVEWRPAWTATTVFVYRNRKQDSRAGIRRYREQDVPDDAVREITDLTIAFSSPSSDLRAAARLLRRHEELVSQTIGLPTIQEELFADFPGQLKSLGAWGGDFFWALSEGGPEKMRAYFNARGFGTVIGYEDMVL